MADEAEGYDLEMIRDFFEQLDWELMAAQQDMKRGARPLSPDLLAEVRSHADRRGTPIIWPLVIFDTEDAPGFQTADCIAGLRGELASGLQEALDAINTLRPTFRDALAIAEQSASLNRRGRIPVFRFKVANILTGTMEESFLGTMERAEVRWRVGAEREAAIPQ